MKIPVKNQNGDTVETIELDDAVFNVPMNHPLVHQSLVIYQLNKRQGTHDTKTKAQVSGGGRKPWIQKHTGRARQGSIRSPQWRHGGVVFGPHPRSYRKSLPRRMRRQALKCVLSDKARQERLVCLDSIDTVDGKTKSMVSLLQRLEISGSTLFITRQPEQSVIRASHNLGEVWTLPVTLLNAHELLRRETVIMTVEAARWAEQVLAAAPQRGSAAPDEESIAIVDTVDTPPEASVEEQPEEAAADEAPEDIDVATSQVGELEEEDSDVDDLAAEEAGEAVEPTEVESLPVDKEDISADEPEAAAEPQPDEVIPDEEDDVSEEKADE